MRVSSFLIVFLLVVNVFAQQAGTGKAQLSLAKTRGVLVFDVGNGTWQTGTNGKGNAVESLGAWRSSTHYRLPSKSDISSRCRRRSCEVVADDGKQVLR